MASRDVNPTIATTTPIRHSEGNGGGTGFFFNHNDRSYLITNQHVINPSRDDVNPETIQVWLRNSPDISTVNRTEIQIRDGNEKYWCRHPTHPNETDLAAVPLDYQLSSLDDLVEQHRTIQSGSLAFTSDYFLHEDVRADQRVTILGYPGDFMDRSTRFPIRRNALIASPYGYLFGEKPIFLTDARMHSGTSGSPVLMNPSIERHEISGIPDDEAQPVYLLGVHSATFPSTYFGEYGQNSLEDEHGDEHNLKLDLNAAWYPELLIEMIDGQT